MGERAAIDEHSVDPVALSMIDFYHDVTSGNIFLDDAQQALDRFKVVLFRERTMGEAFIALQTVSANVGERFRKEGNLRVADYFAQQENQSTSAMQDLNGQPSLTPPAGISELTARELEVLKANAFAPKQQSTADSLGISITTLKTHLKRGYRKLGVSSYPQAAMRLIALGVIDPKESGL